MPSRISNPPAPIASQVSSPAAPSKGATSARVDENGAVYAKIDGSETIVGQSALDAWTAGNGRFVIYSGRDGAGGYENEGMSLRAFDTQTGETKKILAEYYMISDVVPVTTSDGKTALIVKMSDGGLGGDHRALVDPERGQVFRSQLSTLLASGDKVTVKTYDADAWAETGMRSPTARPTKTETFSLRELMSRPVIQNRHTHETDTFTPDDQLPPVELHLPAQPHQPYVPAASGQVISPRRMTEADRALGRLVEGGAPAEGTPYRGVSEDSLKAWLGEFFGPVESLTGRNAEIAAELLGAHAPGMSVGTRSLAFELQGQLQNIARQ